MSINALPHGKFLDWSELKHLQRDKINRNEKLKFVLGREKNIVGKEENAGDQHFILFPQCFQRSFSSQIKVGIVC